MTKHINQEIKEEARLKSLNSNALILTHNDGEYNLFVASTKGEQTTLREVVSNKRTKPLDFSELVSKLHNSTVAVTTLTQNADSIGKRLQKELNVDDFANLIKTNKQGADGIMDAIKAKIQEKKKTSLGQRNK